MVVSSNPIGAATTINKIPMSSEPPREASVLCLRRYGGNEAAVEERAGRFVLLG